MKHIEYKQLTKAQIAALNKISYGQATWLLFATWGQIAILPFLYYLYPNLLLLVLSVFIIGARQASLYEINHEAAHFKLAKTKKANERLALVFCTIPFLHHPEAFSFVQWRRAHRLHHVYTMTEKDPNYVQRQLANEVDKPFTFITSLRAIVLAVVTSWFGLWLVKQDYVFPDGKRFIKHRYRHWRYLLPIKNDAEMQKELLYKWLGTVTLLLVVFYFSLQWYFLVFWLLPMYTVYPAILKLMDIMDHRWSDTSGQLERNTCSRSVGFWQRFFTSNLHRYYHLEHHLHPKVPALNMPALHKQLFPKDCEHG